MTLTRRTTACFLLGATGKGWTINGNSLIGSVSDDPYDIRTFLKLKTEPDAIDFIGTELISTTKNTLADRGYFARPGETTRGLNASGLGFTCAMVIEDPTIKKPDHLPEYADITDEMLRTCESVEDALQLFSSRGASFPAYSVLLTDAIGDLAHLEIGSFGLSVVNRFSNTKPGVVLAVNCYQTPTFIQYNDPITQLDNLQNNNSARLERGRQLTEQYKGIIDFKTMLAILTDHENRQRNPLENPVLPGWGYSICNHGTRGKDDYPYEDLPWGTVSSEIIEPSSGLFWYSYGWACGDAAEFGDQLFQENSWGKFLPFKIEPFQKDLNATKQLTKITGEITVEGIRSLSN